LAALKFALGLFLRQVIGVESAKTSIYGVSSVLLSLVMFVRESKLKFRVLFGSSAPMSDSDRFGEVGDADMLRPTGYLRLLRLPAGLSFLEMLSTENYCQ